MDIRVSGHQVDTGAAFEAHAEERLSAIVDKYFSRALTSHVTLGKAPHGGFRCDIVTHVAQGLILKGSAVAQDAHIALDRPRRSTSSCAVTSAGSMPGRTRPITPAAKKKPLTPSSLSRRPRPKSRPMRRSSLRKPALTCRPPACRTR